MLPYISFFGLIIPSYSLMVLIGAILFTVITIILFEKKEKIPQKITNRILVISLVGFVGLVFFAFVANSLFHSLEQGRIVLGGIAWLGGVLGAFPLMVYLLYKFCHNGRMSSIESFNYLIPGLVIAHGMGRIGCFLGGCCYGKVTDSVFGVVFPEGSNAAEKYPSEMGGSLPVLPTQLYEAIFDFLLFAVMIIFYKKLKERFTEVYCFSYGVFRFILEFWRGDDRGSTGFALSPSQLMSIVLIGYGVAVIFCKRGKILKRFTRKDCNKNDSIEEINLNYRSRLAEAKKMLDDGLITEEEYEQIKAGIIFQLSGKQYDIQDLGAEENQNSIK